MKIGVIFKHAIIFGLINFALMFCYSYFLGGGISYDYNWDNDYDKFLDFPFAIHSSTWFGIVMTAVGVFFGFIGYLTEINKDTSNYSRNSEYYPETQEPQKAIPQANDSNITQTCLSEDPANINEPFKSVMFPVTNLNDVIDKNKLLSLKNGDYIVHKQLGKLKVWFGCQKSPLTKMIQ